MTMCGLDSPDSPLPNSLSFRNLAGVLRLTLTGTATIDSIRVSALGADEYIAGGFDLSLPEIISFTSGEKTVTLKCGESGVTLSKTEGTVFNIVIPPITGGFKVAICDSEHGVMILQSESEIKRSKILNMPAVDYAPDAMVDLGLSVYWATCNVGADTPEGYGYYFAWGETEPYYEADHAYDDPCENWKEGKSSGYTWDSYSFTSDGGSTFTKYNGTDGKTTLEPTDDAATANLGADWRMPTIDEFEELFNNCDRTWITQKWTTQDSVNVYVYGCKVVSKKEGYEGVSIFLPAGVCRYGDSLGDSFDDFGYYWSSSLNLDDPIYASFLFFHEGATAVNDFGRRYCGMLVRPVTE